MQRNRRRPEQAADEVRAEESLAPAQPALVQRVLALQRSAGNHAVGALIARETKEREAPAAAGLASLKGMDPIPIESASMLDGPPVAGGGGAAKRKAEEVRVLSRAGEHSAKLMEANAQGKRFETAEIEVRGLRIALRGAAVSEYTVASDDQGPLEQWTVLFEEIQVGASPAPKAP